MPRPENRTLTTLLGAAALSIGSVAFGEGPYAGDALVRAFVEDAEELSEFLTYTDDVWSHRIGPGIVDARVTAEQLAALDASGLLFAVLEHDIQALIDLERASMQARVGGFFDAFRDNVEISAHADGLVAARPDLIARQSLGLSLEGRDIYALRISGAGTDKPIVLFIATQHAREWIAPMTAMYIADTLVNTYDTDPRVAALLDAVEVVIVPVVNPDGYEYSWGPERLWRKNRRGGYGVDNNRNWGVGWGGIGSSSSIGSQVYHGTAPFSEPENQVIRDFVLGEPNLRVLTDIHSYGQLVLSPLGYTTALAPDPDWISFERMTEEVELAIESVHGTDYFGGAAGADQYPAGGDAPDWHYVDNDLLSWTLELRPTSSPPGFILDASEIVPVGEEIFEGALVLGQLAMRSVSIGIVEPAPLLVAPGQSLVIDAEIFPLPINAVVDASSVMLHARTDGVSPFAPIAMSAMGNDVYSAALPTAPVEGVVEFYITAKATDGPITTFPMGGASNPVVLPVATADFNSDGVVDGVDLAYLLASWGTSDPLIDLTGDGTVDSADLSVLLASWG